ncbi:hypothetical protein NC652_004002 [Populus alba x Populus x berolinensis]|nr:hypothetical protein NC652_004002 [Populus alba x Populus x berolinensis]
MFLAAGSVGLLELMSGSFPSFAGLHGKCFSRWLGWLMLVYWKSGPSCLNAVFGCLLFSFVGPCSPGPYAFLFFLGAVHAFVYGILFLFSDWLVLGRMFP